MMPKIISYCPYIKLLLKDRESRFVEHKIKGELTMQKCPPIAVLMSSSINFKCFESGCNDLGFYLYF